MSVNTLRKNGLTQVLNKHEAEIVSEWVNEQASNHGRTGISAGDADLRKECSEFIALLKRAIEQPGGDRVESPAYTSVREMLQHLSRSRGLQGYSPSQTAIVRVFAQEAALHASSPRA